MDEMIYAVIGGMPTIALLIIIGIILIIVGIAVYYIRKEKKKGTRCIGCPSSGCCGNKGCCGDK